MAQDARWLGLNSAPFRHLVAGAALLVSVAAPAGGQNAASALSQYLAQTIRLSAKELAAVERCEPVVKSIDTKQDREVSIFGILVTSASRDALTRQARDHATWLRSPTRTRLGIFSEPPRLSDLQNLAVDPNIVDELRKCRPGSCNVKLPASAMEEIRAQLATASDPVEQMNAFTRQRLLSYVQDYRAHGDSAMVVYDDNNPVRASTAFTYLLARSSRLYQYVPAFAGYIAGFPRIPLEGVDDTFFWAEESAPSLRHTITVIHQATYSPPELPGLTLIVEKQIYASHYFEGALDITAIVDRPAGGSYIVLMRRYLFDALPGGIFGVRRRAVNSLKDRMTGDLRRIRTLGERAP